MKRVVIESPYAGKDKEDVEGLRSRLTPLTGCSPSPESYATKTRLSAI